MSIDLSELSIAEWFPDQEKHKCGYCKNQEGSITYGMWTEELTVEDYQDLIDRGWRRSGKYCYKPIMDETCCPQYTIKCETLDFSLNKSHKKIINKFSKFLSNGILNGSDIPQEGSSSNAPNERAVFSKEGPSINFSKTGVQNNINNKSEGHELSMGEPHVIKKGEGIDKQISTESVKPENKTSQQSSLKQKKSFKKGVGPDKNKPPCKKAKLLRLERKKEKMMQKGMEFEPNKSEIKQKTLEEFLNEVSTNEKHKLKLKLMPTSEPDTEWEIVKNIEFELYKKYQMIIHNDPLEKLSVSSFTRFLVTSPLKPKKFPNDIEGPGYGSFHQQYWIDDKLIAVGVIDILPKCVSSVYFFYDPDYRDLTLGTYGSLREIELTRALHSKISDIKSYYMGFYIHSCTKMRYKGKLVPSFLLCPETFVWIPIEKCIPKLDVNKYARLLDDIDAVDEDACTENDVWKIKVVYNRSLCYFRDYFAFNKDEKEVFENIGRLIGKKCAKRIIFWMK